MTIEGQGVKICTGEKCIDVPLARKGTTYINISSQKKGQAPLIRSVEALTGEARVRAIDDSNKGQ